MTTQTHMRHNMSDTDDARNDAHTITHERTTRTHERHTRRRYRRAILVRMTDAEYRKLQAHAQLHGMSMSRYIVESALGCEHHITVMTPDDRQMVERVAAQIRRTGANVMTLMRAHWLGGVVQIDELRAARKELDELREVLKRWLS